MSTLPAYRLKQPAPPSELCKIGEKVAIPSTGQQGTLRFVGKTKFKEGIWAGIELDGPDGKNDGSIAGVSYFQCPPSHGIFIHFNRITKVSSPVTSPQPLRKSNDSLNSRYSSAIPSPLQPRKVSSVAYQSKTTSSSSLASKSSSTMSLGLVRRTSLQRPTVQPARQRVSISSLNDATDTTSKLEPSTNGGNPPMESQKLPVQSTPSKTTLNVPLQFNGPIRSPINDRLQAHVDVLEAQNALLTLELNQARNKLGSMQDKVESLTSKLAQASPAEKDRSSPEEWLAQIDSLRNANAQLESSNEQYRAALKVLAEERSREQQSVTERMKQYKSELSVVVAEREDSWASERAEMISTIQTLELIKSEQSEKITSLLHSATLNNDSKVEATIVELKDQIGNLEFENAQLLDRIDTARIKVSNLQTENESLKQNHAMESEKVLQTLAAVQKERDALNDRLSKLPSNDKGNHELKILEDQLKTEIDSKRAVDKELENMRAEMAEKVKQVVINVKTIKDLNSKISDLQKELDTVIRQNSQLQTSHSSETEKLQSELKTRNNQIEEIRKQLITLESEQRSAAADAREFQILLAAHQESMHKEQEAALREKESMGKKLEAMNQLNRTLQDKLETQLASLDKDNAYELTKKENNIRSLEDSLGSLKKKLSESEDMSRELQDQVAALNNRISEQNAVRSASMKDDMQSALDSLRAELDQQNSKHIAQITSKHQEAIIVERKKLTEEFAAQMERDLGRLNDQHSTQTKQERAEHNKALKDCESKVNSSTVLIDSMQSQWQAEKKKWETESGIKHEQVLQSIKQQHSDQVISMQRNIEKLTNDVKASRDQVDSIAKNHELELQKMQSDLSSKHQSAIDKYEKLVKETQERLYAKDEYTKKIVEDLNTLKNDREKIEELRRRFETAETEKQNAMKTLEAKVLETERMLKSSREEAEKFRKLYEDSNSKSESLKIQAMDDMTQKHDTMLKQSEDEKLRLQKELETLRNEYEKDRAKTIRELKEMSEKFEQSKLNNSQTMKGLETDLESIKRQKRETEEANRQLGDRLHEALEKLAEGSNPPTQKAFEARVKELEERLKQKEQASMVDVDKVYKEKQALADKLECTVAHRDQLIRELEQIKAEAVAKPASIADTPQPGSELICYICDAIGDHKTDDCPTTKLRWCDNCEVDDHDTSDCPHSDETF